MQKIQADLRFQTPCSIQIVGPTMSGKSSLVRNLLTAVPELFHPIPKRILYIYGIWQDEFNSISGVEFYKDLNKIFEEGFIDPKDNTLIVLDDLMEEIAKHKAAASLFTRGVHHKNASVIFLTQNLYKQGKSMRDIALNCQYVILFKSVRDVNQIKHLAKQTGISHLPLAYEKATSLPYGYVLIDLHPKTIKELRLQSNLFGYRKIYLSK